MTPPHSDHVHATTTRPRRGVRRAPEARPWPVLGGFGFTLGGGVAAVEAFSLAGWSEVQIIGLLATYGTLSGLLLAVWGALAKLLDGQARLADTLYAMQHGKRSPQGITYAAAYLGAKHALSDKTAKERIAV